MAQETATLAAYVAKMHARPSYAGWVEKEKAFFAKRAVR